MAAEDKMAGSHFSGSTIHYYILSQPNPVNSRVSLNRYNHMGSVLVIMIFFFVFSFFNLVKANDPSHIIIYKNANDQLAMAMIDEDKIGQYAYIEVPHGTIYTVNRNHIYLHDINSSSYRLCEVNGTQLANCTVNLVDNFKTNKIAIVNSRLYMLGNTVRSCYIGRNGNIGNCINESQLTVNSSNPGESYTKIQRAPSEQNKIILTKKTTGAAAASSSTTSIVCQVKDDHLSSCKDIGDGSYKVIPGEHQYIYKFEPALKKIMICIYNPTSSYASNCTSVISDFDIVADDITFMTYYDKLRENRYTNVFIRDTQKKSLIKCHVNNKNHTFSSCIHIETNTLIDSSPVVFKKEKPSPLLNTYYIQDGLTFSKENGSLSALCNTIDKKKLLCTKEIKKEITSGFSSIFIRDYASSDVSKKQYAYLIDRTGREITECSFNPDNILTEAINNCEIRKDIHLPVKIISGLLLSEANMLLLTGQSSEIYQCQYDSENRLKSCKNTGLMNFDSTHMAFDAIHKKIYFYSKKANKINACNIVEQTVRNCYSVNIDSSMTNDTVQNILISSDFSHILLADKSTINYCSLNSWEPRLEKCIHLSDHFSSITSLAYSKNQGNLLYVLDNNIMKSCLIKDNKISCDTMSSNDNIEEMPVNKFTVSVNYLRAGINLLPVKIKNKGGYILKATYSTYSKGEKQRVGTSKKTAAGQKFIPNILAGSAVELYALAGRTKCIIVDKPGTISCTGSTFTMACYYNGSSKRVIDGDCPLTSFKITCTPKVIKRLKSTVRHCTFHVNEEKGLITSRCEIDCDPWSWGGCLHESKVHDCSRIMKEMQL